MIIRSWEITVFFAWYDLWVGAYYDRERRTLYILPLPCCGIRIRFGMSRALWAAMNMVVDPEIAKIMDEVMTVRCGTCGAHYAHALTECPSCGHPRDAL